MNSETSEGFLADPSPESNGVEFPREDPDLLAKANLKFAFDLYSQVLHDNPNRNIFASPASISMALAMMYNGSAGRTRATMAQALGIAGMPPEEVNRACAERIQDSRELGPGVCLEIANSVWLRSGVELQPEFHKLIADYCAGSATTLDFSDDHASDTINQWVQERTAGKIKKIVPDVIPADVLTYLINAVYFKADWHTAFDRTETRSLPFHLTDGTERTHPMMRRNGFMPYLETDEFQAVGLAYGKNGRATMDLFVPKGTIESLHAVLKPEKFEQWMEKIELREGEVILPRFKFEFAAELSRSLSALGMAEVFGIGADFSAMSPAQVYISRVLHKTCVDLTEEGTEAAAGTASEIELCSGTRPFHVLADRPFFWVIRDQLTGSILFMGSVLDPQG